MRPGEDATGHLGLAAHDYTHSLAPNRRFADMATRRLVKSPAAGGFADEELETIARNCRVKEDAARKVSYAITKRLAAVALGNRIGQAFSAVVRSDI